MIKDSNYERVIYDEVDGSLVDHIISYIDDNADMVFSFFGYKPDKKVDIYIVKDKDNYDTILKGLRNSNEDIPKWNIGTTTYDGRIYYLSLNDYANTSHQNETLDGYKKTILHEFVHFVTYEYCNNKKISYPHQILLEGIAQYLSNQNSEKEIKYNPEKDFSYDNALYVVRYIMDNKGKDYFLYLLEHDEIKGVIEEIKKLE